MLKPNFDSNDLYEILGLEKTCSEKDIKSSFRKLAKQYHPDKSSKEDQIKHSEIFVKVNKSYEVLSNTQARSKYDRETSKPSFDYSNLDFEQWSDLFTDYFSDIFGSHDPIRGEDVHVYCRLTLEELKLGCVKTITISKERLKVTIPKECKPDTVLKVPNKGTFTNKCSQPGDLFIRIVAKPHTHYTFSKSGDLQTSKTITYQHLIMGTDIILTTLTGKVKIKLPPRSDINQECKLKGLGIQGDIILKFKLYIPQSSLTTAEIEAVTQLNKYSNLTLNS